MNDKMGEEESPVLVRKRSCIKRGERKKSECSSACSSRRSSCSHTVTFSDEVGEELAIVTSFLSQEPIVKMEPAKEAPAPPRPPPPKPRPPPPVENPREKLSLAEQAELMLRESENEEEDDTDEDIDEIEQDAKIEEEEMPSKSWNVSAFSNPSVKKTQSLNCKRPEQLRQHQTPSNTPLSSSPQMTPRHMNPNQSQLNPSANQRNLISNKVSRGLTRAGSLTGVQEGKRLKNTRINLQDEDSTIIAFNTPEVPPSPTSPRPSITLTEDGNDQGIYIFTGDTDLEAAWNRA